MASRRFPGWSNVGEVEFGGEPMGTVKYHVLATTLALLLAGTGSVWAATPYPVPRPQAATTQAKQILDSTAKASDIARIPDGELLRPGMDDPRVPLLRKRLKTASDASDTKYDGQLVEAVKKFQASMGLDVDGILGPATLHLLNGDSDVSARIPIPEPLNVPPPTAKDFGAPGAAAPETVIAAATATSGTAETISAAPSTTSSIVNATAAPKATVESATANSASATSDAAESKSAGAAQEAATPAATPETAKTDAAPGTTSTAAKEAATPAATPETAKIDAAPATTSTAAQETATPAATAETAKTDAAPVTTSTAAKEAATPAATPETAESSAAPVTTSTAAKETATPAATPEIAKTDAAPVTTSTAVKETATPAATPETAASGAAPVATSAAVKETATPAAAPETAKTTAKTEAAPSATPTSATAATQQPPAASEVASKPPVVVPPDPVAEKLHVLVTEKLSRFIDRKGDREGVAAFYAARHYAPLWTDKGLANDKAKAAIAYLAHVDADGLYPSDYPTPTFKPGADPQALAEAELKLTGSVITFARHAQNGRVAFSRVSPDIYYDQHDPDPKEVLASIATASDAAKALDANLPQEPQYKALKAKLAELRSGTTAERKVVHIPDGQLLRPGMKDARVPLLRKRLKVTGGATGTTYDDQLVEAVKSFQTSKGLEVDGVVGSDTRNALNDVHSRAQVIDTILANMERWRWLPHNLGKTYVMLNIPEFRLKVIHDGNTVWSTEVVVGKPDKPTPILSAEMKYITVNPTWNVPPSIVYEEYLPLLYQDPTALDRYGLKVTQDENGGVHMYQPPGDTNALGRLRFNFPNKFLVYQHDTPEKYLFNKTVRAYSHGCMRVQNPLKYAEVLLSLVAPKEHYTQARLRAMYGNEEKEIPFKTYIPVHVTYQTAYVDDLGKLVIRDDIYGRDAQTLAPLKENRRVADVPVDHKAEMQASYARPPVDLPYGVVTGDSSNSYSAPDGSSFFEMLFGGGRYYARPRAYVGSRRFR
jgi:L,D-transpeptidase YcbB